MTWTTGKLKLHEEVMLISLRDEEGTIERRATSCDFALAGALLAQLSLDNRVTIEPGKKQTVIATGATTGDDPLLDEVLATIRASKKQRRAADWIARLARLKGLRARVAGELARKGILRVDEGKILLIFKRRIYPTIDPGPERRIRERLRSAINGATMKPQPRTAILLALAKSAGMLRIYFDRQLLKDNRRRIEEIVRLEGIGAATRKAIAAAQAAAIAATTAATAAR